MFVFQVYLAEPAANGTFSSASSTVISEIYHLSGKKRNDDTEAHDSPPPIRREVEVWARSDSGRRLSVSPVVSPASSVWERRGDLNGSLLRVAMVDYKPFTFLREGREPEG